MDKQQSCVRATTDHKKISDCIEKIDRIDTALVRWAQVLDLMGNENRLKIIYLIQEDNNLCVCDLSDILGMSIPAVSQHLRKLKDGKLIQARKVGQTVFYSLRAEVTDQLQPLLTSLESKQIAASLAE